MGRRIWDFAPHNDTRYGSELHASSLRNVSAGESIWSSIRSNILWQPEFLTGTMIGRVRWILAPAVVVQALLIMVLMMEIIEPNWQQIMTLGLIILAIQILGGISLAVQKSIDVDIDP